MKKNRKILITALLIYLLLLILLVYVEAGAPGSSIHSLWDAVWFSLITMTTVGYGDLSPVTPAGRVLGLVFALCSIGLLSILISIGLRILSGRLLPMLRLYLGRKKQWFVFSEENADTTAFAKRLAEQNPEALIVFPWKDDVPIHGQNVIRMEADIDYLVRIRKTPEGIALFCMSRDPWKNFEQGLSAAKKQLSAYSMTEAAMDELPPELHLFSQREVLGRGYWKNHPLQANEHTVLIIGCGETGSAILERALLTNVFEPGRKTVYHVFDDRDGFTVKHPEIVAALSEEENGEDHVVFHREPWEQLRPLVETADRIIFSRDDDAENLQDCETLRNWFATGAAVHLRLSTPVEGICSFGTREEILTPEFVMKDEINRRAILLNEIYNRNAAKPVAWRELSHFLRQSNIAAADHLIIKLRFLLGDESLAELTEDKCREAYARYREAYRVNPDLFQEIEHRRWVRFHQMYNWQYAPERDNAMRRHPMLLNYRELSEEEQRKDAYAWELLGQLYPADRSDSEAGNLQKA